MTTLFAPEAWLFWLFVGLVLGVVFGVSAWIIATTLVSYDKRSPMPQPRQIEPCWCAECAAYRNAITYALLSSTHAERFAAVRRLVSMGVLDPPHDRLGHMRQTQQDAWEENDA